MSEADISALGELGAKKSVLSWLALRSNTEKKHPIGFTDTESGNFVEVPLSGALWEVRLS